MLEDEVGSSRPPKRNVVAHLFVTYDWKKEGDHLENDQSIF
jgi:hypothetical protein